MAPKAVPVPALVREISMAYCVFAAKATSAKSHVNQSSAAKAPVKVPTAVVASATVPPLTVPST